MLLDWAKIVDCGDAPLTFLVCHVSIFLLPLLTYDKDNTAALKQLDKAHKVSRIRRETVLD